MALDNEIWLLASNCTWKPDSHPKSLPLPMHVASEVKRNPDESFARCKATMVAGGNFHVYEENFIQNYALIALFTVARIFVYLTVNSITHRAKLIFKTAIQNRVLIEDRQHLGKLPTWDSEPLIPMLQAH